MLTLTIDVNTAYEPAHLQKALHYPQVVELLL